MHQETCGLFGKIPQQSDFISHHFPDTFTDQWHHWMQACISISREQLGDEWLSHYMVSPVWQFALMPGLVSEHAVLGVVIPSVDEVGRYFPVVLGHSGQHDTWSAYLNGEAWYQQIQKIALLALAEETSYSQLLGELESLPTPEFETLAIYKTQSSLQAFKGNQITQQSDGIDKNEFVLSLTSNAYKQIYGDHSLWWTAGSEAVAPCLAVSSGLPDPGQYAAMLDGQWQHWGWAEECIITNTTAEGAQQ